MKRALSIILSVCLLCGVLCAVNVLSIRAADAPTPTQQEVTLKDNLNFDDSSYIDAATSEGVTTLVDVWTGSTENGTSYQIDAGKQLVYRIPLPTNIPLASFDFVTSSNGNVSVELSVDGKAGWLPLAKTDYDGFTSSFALSGNTAVPAMPSDGVIYARITGDSARLWVFKYRYYTFGEEYGVLAEGAAEGSRETEIKVGEISETTRLADAGGTSCRDPFGSGLMREITAGSGAEVIYYIDLPDTATGYSFASYYADDMRLWVSRDKETWLPLNNGGKVDLGAYTFAGDASVLQDNDAKAFWVKVSSVEGLLYMNLVLKYTYGPAEETPDPNPPAVPDVVIRQPTRMEAVLLNHGAGAYDDGYVDAVSAEGVGKRFNYWNGEDTDTKNHIGRGVSGEEWLIYRLTVPTNTKLQTYTFNSCGTTNGAMDISTDKENWIELSKVADGTFFGEHLSYGFAKGEAPQMPENGTIYLRMRSADGGMYYWQGLFMYYYGYGEEPSRTVTDGALQGETEIAVDSFGEQSRLVDTGDTSHRNPFGNGEMREIPAGSSASVVYYIDLPDGATDYSFASYYADDMRLWVSRDNSTWIPLNEGGKVGLGAYTFAGDTSILDNNRGKCFYVRISSAEGLLYRNLVVKYTYGKPETDPGGEDPVTPGETVISVTPGTLAELDYIDTLHAANLNGSSRIAEGANYVQYLFDIPADATVATLGYTVRGDYKVSVSLDGTDYFTLRRSLGRDFTYSTTPNVTETLQLSRFLTGEGKKTLYVQFADTTKEDLCGLWLSNITLTYYTDGRTPTEAELAEEEVVLLPAVGSAVTRMDCFAPNTTAETNYEVSNNTTPDNFFSNPCRRLYENTQAVYKFTYDASATDIRLWVQTLGANRHEISKNGTDWETVYDRTETNIMNLEFDANHLMADNADRTVYLRTTYIGPAGDSSLLLWAGLLSTFVYDGTNIDTTPAGPVRPTDHFTAEDASCGLSVIVPADAVPAQVTGIEVGGETVEGGVIYNEILKALDPAYTDRVIFSTFLCDQELNAITLKAPATVTIAIPQALAGKAIDVYMYDTETFTLTRLEAVRSDGALTFDTAVMDHLILAARSSGETDSSNGENERSDAASGDNSFVDTGVESRIVPVMLLTALAAAALIVSKKRFASGK